eukprot:6900733-Lingulodinium_polyedra.AAC.1
MACRCRGLSEVTLGGRPGIKQSQATQDKAPPKGRRYALVTLFGPGAQGLYWPRAGPLAPGGGRPPSGPGPGGPGQARALPCLSASTAGPGPCCCPTRATEVGMTSSWP